jgi:hypothetical protein
MTDVVEEDPPRAAGSTSPAATQAEKGGEFEHTFRYTLRFGEATGKPTPLSWRFAT